MHQPAAESLASGSWVLGQKNSAWLVGLCTTATEGQMPRPHYVTPTLAAARATVLNKQWVMGKDSVVRPRDTPYAPITFKSLSFPTSNYQSHFGLVFSDDLLLDVFASCCIGRKSNIDSSPLPLQLTYRRATGSTTSSTCMTLTRPKATYPYNTPQRDDHRQPGLESVTQSSL